MSPVHPDAVGSYGKEVERWLEREQGVTLRWWQRLATRRQLEHDADGKLCWKIIVETCPRRSGKSQRQASVASWWMAHQDEVFSGNPQTVLHSGSDVAICREVQSRVWFWATEVAGWKSVQTNGKEVVSTPSGSRWVVRAQGAVYGWPADLALVDEGWAVPSATVDEGMEPSIMERPGGSSQLWLTSTAHRKATSLMRRRINAALSGMGEDWRNLLLYWGIGPDDDLGDPDAWRRASPYWSEDRFELISDRYERAMRGESDPEADDPNPMEGFAAQYCNRWPELTAKPLPGDPVLTEAEWESLNGYVPGTPLVAAVEAWFQQGAALTLAEQLGDGRVGVSTVTFGDVPAAVAAAQASGASTVLVGKSLAAGLVGVEAVGGTTRQAVLDLRRFIDDGILSHDGSEGLAEQVLALRTVASSDGPRLASKSRADAVKATAWAVDRARTAGGVAQIW